MFPNNNFYYLGSIYLLSLRGYKAMLRNYALFVKYADAMAFWRRE